MASASASYSQWNVDNEDEEFASDELQTSEANRDSILFVIDCGPAMHVPDEKGNVPVKVAFDSVASVLTSKIFTSASDYVGVLLYGTSKKNNVAGREHVYVLEDLDIPDAERIKIAESFGSNGTRDIRSEYGATDEEFPFGNVFWACSELFATSSQKRGMRRVFLITNEDNPHSKNPGLRSAAIRRAKDLWEVGVRIELFGLNKADHQFDDDLFYRDVLAMEADMNEDDEYGLDARNPRGSSNNLDELLVCIRRKEVKKRAQFRIPFQIAEGLQIGVRGYALIMEAKRGVPIKVSTSGQQIEEVETVTTYKCADTGQYLLPTDIKYAFPYANEQIVFTQDEVNSMRKVGEPGLVFIGTKPADAVSSFYNIRHGYFLYPDESEYEGSTRTFTALLRALHQTNKVAICAFFRRVNAMPAIVALFPQREEVGSNGAQIQPPGFHLIPMPFADDIRGLPVNSTIIAAEEQVDKMKDVVARLMIKGAYDPNAYENPALQLHFATLQAVALDKDIGEVPDKTLPKIGAIKKRVGHILEEFNSKLPADESEQTGHKRTVSNDSNSATSKRVKSDKSVEDHYRDETLDHCTVAMLKEWLRSRNVSPKQRKADLIAQVCDILDKKE